LTASLALQATVPGTSASLQEETMKIACGSIVRTFLCSGLLVGSLAFARAQEPATPAPDNSKVNQRDQSPNEPTADQQKENPADRATSQQIRQALMDDKSLSTYAHNVKIITQNGQVTLKGPVQSEAEKTLIDRKAMAVAGRDKVTNELSVVPQQ
jgi:osmotically-inducible protein OsmY